MQAEERRKLRQKSLNEKIEQDLRRETNTNLDLLIGGHSAENDFCEILRGEHPKTNSTNRFVVLDKR